VAFGIAGGFVLLGALLVLSLRAVSDGDATAITAPE
jgi:hypothetical protein